VLVVVMRVLVAMRMFCSLITALWSLSHDYFNLGARQPAAHHCALLKPRVNIQRRCSLRQQLKGNSRIDKGAKQHIAADAGEALKVSNSHRVVILNCRRGERCRILALEPV
jgi:hypothetical protein